MTRQQRTGQTVRVKNFSLEGCLVSGNRLENRGPAGLSDRQIGILASADFILSCRIYGVYASFEFWPHAAAELYCNSCTQRAHAESQSGCSRELSDARASTAECESVRPACQCMVCWGVQHPPINMYSSSPAARGTAVTRYIRSLLFHRLHFFQRRAANTAAAAIHMFKTRCSQLCNVAGSG